MTNKTPIYILSLGHHDENWDNEKIYKHVFFLCFGAVPRIPMKFHYFSDEVFYYGFKTILVALREQKII